MRLTMRERRGVVNAAAKRYQQSTKKDGCIRPSSHSGRHNNSAPGRNTLDRARRHSRSRNDYSRDLIRMFPPDV